VADKSKWISCSATGSGLVDTGFVVTIVNDAYEVHQDKVMFQMSIASARDKLTGKTRPQRIQELLDSNGKPIVEFGSGDWGAQSVKCRRSNSKLGSVSTRLNGRISVYRPIEGSRYSIVIYEDCVRMYRGDLKAMPAADEPHVGEVTFSSSMLGPCGAPVHLTKEISFYPFVATLSPDCAEDITAALAVYLLVSKTDKAIQVWETERRKKELARRFSKANSDKEFFKDLGMKL
jgi:hypothetical protein